jgi:hypothetical protein
MPGAIDMITCQNICAGAEACIKTFGFDTVMPVGGSESDRNLANSGSEQLSRMTLGVFKSLGRLVSE